MVYLGIIWYNSVYYNISCIQLLIGCVYNWLPCWRCCCRVATSLSVAKPIHHVHRTAQHSSNLDDGAEQSSVPFFRLAFPLLFIETCSTEMQLVGALQRSSIIHTQHSTESSRSKRERELFLIRYKKTGKLFFFCLLPSGYGRNERSKSPSPSEWLHQV